MTTVMFKLNQSIKQSLLVSGCNAPSVVNNNKRKFERYSKTDRQTNRQTYLKNQHKKNYMTKRASGTDSKIPEDFI